MKKFLLSSIAILAIFIAPSCKKDNSEPDPIDPPIRVIRETDLYGTYDISYDAQYRGIKTQGMDFVVDYDYSVSGKVISNIIFYDTGGSNDTTHRVFSLQNGYATEQFRTNQDGSTQLRVYTRDAQFRTIKESFFDASGNLTNEVSYEYDAQGNRSKVTSMVGADVHTQEFEYSGSIANTLLYGLSFFGPDEPLVPSKRRHLVNGEEVEYTDYSYETDTKGRIVRKTQKTIYPDNPNLNTTFVSTYEY